MKKLIISALLLIGIFQMNARAQQKFERESRLNPDEVTAGALQFINSVKMDTRWKWYFEENLVGNSVEAKTKHNGKWYSVEFDTSGKIQDVEVEKDFSEIDEKTGGKIIKELDSMFSSHKIDKIQIQFTAESTVLLEILNNKADQADSKIQFEIVVKGKKTGRPKLYELTFDDKGNLLDSAEIIFRNTDNLEF
jgi:hypothetical protein